MMRRSTTLILSIGLAAAQTMDRTKPPQTGPLPAYKLPPVYETKLSNGLGIELVEDARFPLVTVRLVFLEGGSKVDPAEQPGLASAVGALLKEGTRTRSSRQIAEQLAEIGGTLRIGADRDALTVSANALAEHAGRLLELVADVARNAAFPPDEIKLYQQNEKQRLAARRATAEFHAGERFSALVFGDHPYGRLSPTPEVIDRLDGPALARFRDTYLVPNNAVVIVLGRLPPRDALRKEIERRFGDWRQKALPPRPAVKPPAPKRRIALVDRPGSVQADVRLGQVAVTRADPDHFPLLVGNAILGTGTSSRLFMDIREAKGYAYQANSMLMRYRESGYFTVVTQVRNEVVTPALEAVLAQLDRMAKEPVTAEELSSQKNFLAGTFVMGLESQNSLADQLALVKAMGLPNQYLETYTTRVRSVEPDQIQKAARKYIAPENATIVVVGDASKIAGAVQKLGEAEMTKAQ
jgi:zinc protease